MENTNRVKYEPSESSCEDSPTSQNVGREKTQKSLKTDKCLPLITKNPQKSSEIDLRKRTPPPMNDVPFSLKQYSACPSSKIAGKKNTIKILEMN